MADILSFPVCSLIIVLTTLIPSACQKFYLNCQFFVFQRLFLSELSLVYMPVLFRVILGICERQSYYMSLKNVFSTDDVNCFAELLHSISIFFFFLFRWYHGRLGRAGAEEMLRDREIGSYLVRESESKLGSFVLSYLGHNYKITHFRSVHGSFAKKKKNDFV